MLNTSGHLSVVDVVHTTCIQHAGMWCKSLHYEALWSWQMNFAADLWFDLTKNVLMLLAGVCQWVWELVCTDLNDAYM